MASLEEVLLMRAAQEQAANQQQGQAAALVGALGGSALGVAGGSAVHGLTKLIRPKAVGQGLGMIKPGARMAGGLVGALVGGGLGMALQKEAAQHPAADILARVQTRGELHPQDMNALQAILADTYSNGPGLA